MKRLAYALGAIGILLSLSCSPSLAMYNSPTQPIIGSSGPTTSGGGTPGATCVAQQKAYTTACTGPKVVQATCQTALANLTNCASNAGYSMPQLPATTNCSQAQQAVQADCGGAAGSVSGQAGAQACTQAMQLMSTCMNSRVQPCQAAYTNLTSQCMSSAGWTTSTNCTNLQNQYKACVAKNPYNP